ncbi:MAG: twin-arginine translocase TatA/TatE family subunit [Chloroflexia bacterium]
MSLGPPELILILLIVLVLFGAGKLPQVFGSLGRGIKEFREAAEGKETPSAPGSTPGSPVPPAVNPPAETPVTRETTGTGK